MKKLLVGLTVLAFTFTLGTAVMSKKSGSMTIDWHKGGKTSKINFSKHKAKGVKCGSCHVKHKNGKRYYKACAKCHGSKAQAKKIGHKMCISCHKKKSGPKTCKGCH